MLTFRAARLRRSIAAALMAFGLAATSSAAEIAGTVSRIMVVTANAGAPGNADLRVYLSGVTACSGATDPNWAFLNLTDPNYKGVLATVLTAQTTGKTLMMGTQLAAVGSGSYCQILYVYLIG
ncbi:hypothetical protein [Rhizobacter sp. OV335]|jgi:hypothetical protein|uniref:hypothetical protein n=1 Tax=Rhizobacter sp. OV335 TaxID=1500264 RepID=UPI00091701C6|nr:hypothetical protein [Rhizobacter sp. OV335]SHN39655.1 hypothetical protein SAMN02787076_06104 [Rhizobacter sp. OV335]